MMKPRNIRLIIVLALLISCVLLFLGPSLASAQTMQDAVRLNEKATNLQNQGHYADAEPLFKKALAIAEKVKGPNHIDVGNLLNNLAELYGLEGRYAEAEPLNQRGLLILEKALGPNHPDVATSLNNLADLYEDQGRGSDL